MGMWQELSKSILFIDVDHIGFGFSFLPSLFYALGRISLILSTLLTVLRRRARVTERRVKERKIYGVSLAESPDTVYLRENNIKIMAFSQAFSFSTLGVQAPLSLESHKSKTLSWCVFNVV